MTVFKNNRKNFCSKTILKSNRIFGFLDFWNLLALPKHIRTRIPHRLNPRSQFQNDNFALEMSQCAIATFAAMSNAPLPEFRRTKHFPKNAHQHKEEKVTKCHWRKGRRKKEIFFKDFCQGCSEFRADVSNFEWMFPSSSRCSQVRADVPNFERMFRISSGCSQVRVDVPNFEWMFRSSSGCSEVQADVPKFEWWPGSSVCSCVSGLFTPQILPCCGEHFPRHGRLQQLFRLVLSRRVVKDANRLPVDRHLFCVQNFNAITYPGHALAHLQTGDRGWAAPRGGHNVALVVAFGAELSGLFLGQTHVHFLLVRVVFLEGLAQLLTCVQTERHVELSVEQNARIRFTDHFRDKKKLDA